MAGIRQQGDFQHCIERQTAWGTPVDSSPGGMITNNLVINAAPDEHNTMHDRGLRFEDEADTFSDTASTIPTAEADVTVDVGFLIDYLPGLLQKSTSWAAAASIYNIYPISGVGTLPLCRTSDEGYFYTITKRSPTVNLSEKLSDAIMRRCVLTIHPKNGQTPGALSAKCEWIGTTYTNTANPSGTVTHDELTTIYKWGSIGDVSIGGTTIKDDFISAEIDMTFNAKLMGDVPTGEAHFPKFEAKVTLVAAQNTTTGAFKSTIRSRAIDTATPIVIRWGDGTLSSNGELNITCFGVPTDFDDTDRTEGEVHTVTFRCVGGTLASNEHPVRFNFYQS